MSKLALLSAVPDYLLAENQIKSTENVALFNAALAGSASEVKRLLDAGAKPNFFHRPEDQKNALHVASEKNHIEVVQLLLEHGAVVNAISATDQATAIGLAGKYAGKEVITMLLAAGADVNHSNGYGNTALHEACHEGNLVAIETLIKQGGAMVNALNKKGSTPFHIYCYHENKVSHPLATALFLIDQGADMTASDQRGMTPLLVCCSSGRVDIIEVLRSKGNVFLHDRDGTQRHGVQIAEFYRQEAVLTYFAQQGITSASVGLGNKKSHAFSEHDKDNNQIPTTAAGGN